MKFLLGIIRFRLTSLHLLLAMSRVYGAGGFGLELAYPRSNASGEAGRPRSPLV